MRDHLSSEANGGAMKEAREGRREKTAASAAACKRRSVGFRGPPRRAIAGGRVRRLGLTGTY
ncbi:hypothetical protein CF647_33210 [Burkholderia sp. 117]|nr:hypothetical protein CF649_35065 [Burkholderia sp. 136(2017)]PNX24886.1 hypothetical protein CF647_33210 [Burkholderia sp. 117]PNX30012.1 hypothetical protein CF648_34950 [Burkholderia sp. 137]